MPVESRDATTAIVWDMLGDRLPPGLLGLSDPDIHVIDGRLTMFIGGFSTTFRNRLYRAVMSADQTGECWLFDQRPLVIDPCRGRWDSGGMHTPSYVAAHEGSQPRIYYAGRATARRYGAGSAYSIGFLMLGEDGTWKSQDNPVLTGDQDRPSVLEPLVIPVEGGYRMWFLSTPHEVDPGEQPDFELHVADSANGIDWHDRRLFATTGEGSSTTRSTAATRAGR